MKRELAMSQLGANIESWGITNDRKGWTVGPYRLAEFVVQWLSDNPDMFAALFPVAPAGAGEQQ